jgi:hypothetical protein
VGWRLALGSPAEQRLQKQPVLSRVGEDEVADEMMPPAQQDSTRANLDFQFGLAQDNPKSAPAQPSNAHGMNACTAAGVMVQLAETVVIDALSPVVGLGMALFDPVGLPRVLSPTQPLSADELASTNSVRSC